MQIIYLETNILGFFGIVGPSNSLCRSESAKFQLKPIGGRCHNDQDCIYSECSNSTCIAPAKQCPSALANIPCSGKFLFSNHHL